MGETVDGAIGRGGIGDDDLRHAARSRRARPAPLPTAARMAADRHSRRVRRLKILLPVAAMVIVLAIVAVAWVQSRLLGALDVKNVLFSKDGLTMVEPHLSGHAKGRAYDVSAQRAFQNLQNPKIIGLEGVDGRIEMADGNWTKIESAKGLYDGTRERLTLEGAVKVTTSNGWQATSERAEADLIDGHVSTTVPLRIAGRNGSIEADGIDVTDGGHRIRFSGNVRMRFLPGEGTDEASPPPPLRP
ncbi:MAG: LPS export ABC transporter periplasmic protein LptC [Siculibacillus sp.]|nr:LPS export ABC transporter periplasmic protein LptC [Siculibacillus sp.]